MAVVARLEGEGKGAVASEEKMEEVVDQAEQATAGERAWVPV